jgi:hypothetical protein
MKIPTDRRKHAVPASGTVVAKASPPKQAGCCFISQVFELDGERDENE